MKDDPKHDKKLRYCLLRCKTRVPGLSCGGVSELLHLAILVVHRLVTNGRTDSKRTRNDSKHSTSIASHGKITSERLAVGMTVKVTHGHQNFLYSTGHISLPISGLFL